VTAEFRSSSQLRQTKIVATIGPASNGPDELERLLRAGVDVCRINCSHADADAIRADISRIRRIAIGLKKHVAVLLDLQGPKIRTGPADSPVVLAKGDVLTVVMDPALMADGHRVGTTWPMMIDDVKTGDRVLFADGALSGHVSAIRPGDPGEIDVEIDAGGELGSHKGINLPQTQIQAPALTEKDIADLAVGVRAGADYVALSFVRTADDVRQLRAHLTKLGRPDLPVIAKIEKPEALTQIDEILGEVQGLMVARGDLGVELDLERVPVVQKELIQAANRHGVPVITATQMLDSMERNPRPTRAETTDVANAILDGTDALMLSGETSVGLYPIEAVAVMDRIAREVENSRFQKPRDLDKVACMAGPAHSVARAACYAVQEGERPLVIFTWSGRTAILASKARLKVPIFALTPDQTVCDRLSLIRGVTAVKLPVFRNTDELIAAGEQVLIDQGHLPEGSEVVVLAGNAPLRGAANLMKIEVLDGKA
jgi:pyruvate kinase